jgi:predicted O-methyltransferase YrrM
MAEARYAIDLRDWALAQRDMAPHIRTLTEYARACRRIVEFGTRGGVSTWAFLDGLPAKGLMWSVDIDACEVPPRVASDPRWTFVQGNDLDYETLAKLPLRADLVFIDTSHEYEHTVEELKVAQTFRPKRILCHDAEWPGVAQALMELEQNTSWRVVRIDEAHDDRGGFSLAIVERSA